MTELSCLPVLIGSLPMTDHREALMTILAYTPQIPLWPQLPKLPREGMVRQFIDGFPGLKENNTRSWIETSSDNFTTDMVQFYEDYLQSQQVSRLPDNSRFSLNKKTANGFFVLLEYLNNKDEDLISVKGQITGPITTGIGIKDEDGNAIIYDDNLRDMLTKLLALRARWQIERLRQLCGENPPLLFIDEPGMVSFGSTAFAGVTREMVCESMNELINEIKEAGGLAGVHICANGDWSPVLESNTDIISFDAYSYFNNFILYKNMLVNYIDRGGILAWGIIPTGDVDAIENETVDNLFLKWQKQLTQLSELGISEKKLLHQTIISPSCGTGSLPLDHAVKVLSLTAKLSEKIRKTI